MQKERTIDVCDNCGYETLNSSEIETTTVRLDEGTYQLDLCLPNGCRDKLAALAHRGVLDSTGIEATAEIVHDEAPAQSTNGTGPYTCIACSREFKTEPGLRVHISRMHT